MMVATRRPMLRPGSKHRAPRASAAARRCRVRCRRYR